MELKVKVTSAVLMSWTYWWDADNEISAVVTEDM